MSCQSHRNVNVTRNANRQYSETLRHWPGWKPVELQPNSRQLLTTCNDLIHQRVETRANAANYNLINDATRRY